jgi:hypothetical protein
VDADAGVDAAGVDAEAVVVAVELFGAGVETRLADEEQATSSADMAKTTGGTMRFTRYASLLPVAETLFAGRLPPGRGQGPRILSQSAS